MGKLLNLKEAPGSLLYRTDSNKSKSVEKHKTLKSFKLAVLIL